MQWPARINTKFQIQILNALNVNVLIRATTSSPAQATSLLASMVMTSMAAAGPDQGAAMTGSKAGV